MLRTPAPALRSTLAVGATMALLVVVPVAAQDRLPNGRLLSLGTSFGLSASDNPDLDPDGDSRVETNIGLSLGLISQTPTQSLEFSTSGSLDLRTGGEDDLESVTLSSPNAAIAYSRMSRASELRLNGSVSVSRFTTLNALELTLDDLVDLEDLEELEALIAANTVPRDARRLTYALGAALETRRTSPFGVSYSLGLSGVRYSDAPDAFEDENRLSAGLGLRFDLNPTLRATTNINVAQSDDDGDERTSVTFGLTQSRPTSSLGANFGIASNNNDTRLNFSVSGAVERPRGQLSGVVGVTRASEGSLTLTGSLAGAYEISRVQSLTFGLKRQVTQIDGVDLDDLDRERVITTANASYEHDLTRLWRLGLDMRYVEANVISGVGGTDTFGQIGAALSHSLTEDWALNMGLRHKFRTNSDGEDADSSTISVSLSRSFQIPY